ncbi:hypothetical protein J6500_02020 [Bradyrhizobium sp. WSM 1704]|nr:hypothetical protein [Bradyrhizobium semiaridum]MCA6120684.1 hypothetical protein [Bradyrhizobium semiaridum]
MVVLNKAVAAMLMAIAAGISGSAAAAEAAPQPRSVRGVPPARASW